jgi:cyclophilin family peptidyl-prolyl cis-trans isomerase
MVRAAGFMFACLASVGHGREMSKLLGTQAASLESARALRWLDTVEVESFSPLEILAISLLASTPAATARSAALEQRRLTATMNDELQPAGLGRRAVTSSAGVAALSSLLPTSAHAKELSSGSGSRVNKDPESLLRYGLPMQPKEMFSLQNSLEEAEQNYLKKQFSVADSNLGSASGKVKSKEIAKAIPPASKSAGEKLLKGIEDDIEKAKGLKTADSVKPAIEKLGELEDLVATSFEQPVPPEQYSSKLPWLKGRATIAMELKRPGGKFDVQNTLYDKLDITMIVDGYTAPITAGNMVDLVSKGFYDGFEIQRADGFVVQTGDPAGAGSPKPAKENGYVPEGSNQVRRIPLEVYAAGDKAPIYDSTFDDEGIGGYASKIPFNSYGALGMAISEGQYDSGSSQFFWLLFDSDLTPGGKNLLDGRYSCFGYTVGNAFLLAGLKEGDVIASAKVVKGLENLVKPA